MRYFLLIATLAAIALAKPKPETYKETEDFQYSRSSSDDGTKSGFYGAQRGNMGGNYERAHNMDNLAQHQMSGLVRQVDGELGSGAKTRTGSVYTAANSRGIYGSGSYDLTNLQGRNFAEGESVGNSQSQLSLSSQNSRYGSQLYSGMENNAGMSSSHSQNSRYSGYQTSRHADQRQIDNLQAVDTSQGFDRYDSNNQAGYNTKYYTQFGSRGGSEFDQSSANLHSSSGYDANSQGHFITTPVRVVIRPGGRVAIPITAPTFGVSQTVLAENNAINSDAEVINQQVVPTPTNKVKHYEASYSYRKQWEKHHAIPGDVSIVVPTENPFPKNSELYEDAQLLQSAKNQLQNANSLSVQTDNRKSDHRSNFKSSSNRAVFQAGYNSQHSQSGFDSQQNQAGFNAQQRQSGVSAQQSQLGLSSQQSQLDLSSQQRRFNAQQSHLGLNSQQNSASYDNSANQYGRSSQTSGMAADLTNAAADVNSKPKSYHSSYSYHKSWERQGDPYVIKPAVPLYDTQASERLTAASANSAAYSSRQYGSHSRQAQQSYSADCDDQAHVRVARSYDPEQEPEQSQVQWENLGQQTQSKLENLEDLGQEQQQSWDNLQDLGQQTQNQWGNFQQLGQETQNQWDNLQQLGQETQNQWDNLQQLGQQTQNQWDNLQQLGQQTQNQWDNLQQLGQQTQDKWDNLEELGQQTHRDQHIEQHQNENLEDFSQLSQKEDGLKNFEQQTNEQIENLDLLSQHTQKEITSNFDQSPNKIENFEEISQQTQHQGALTNFEQQAFNQNEHLGTFSQSSDDFLTNFEQQKNNPNENLPNNNNFPVEQFLTVNEQNQNNRNLFDQSPQDIWNQGIENIDKNTNTHDFMKPIDQVVSKSDKNLQEQAVEEKHLGVNDNNNLLSFPLTNIGYNDLWHPNSNQYNFWTTNKTYEHNIWNANNLNYNNNQFEDKFSLPQPVNNVENPLADLWGKIDNIAGEFTPTQGSSDSKNLFAHDVTNFHSENENVYQIQTEYSSNQMPVNPNVNLVITNINTKPKENELEPKNLFDEQTESTSTTTSSIVLPHYSSKPVENFSTSTNYNELKPIDPNKNIHSQDEGRGDIEPEPLPFEITDTDKPYTTPQEIETLNHTKETQIPEKVNTEAMTQQTAFKKEHDYTDKKLETDLDKGIDRNKKIQGEILHMVPSKVTITTPILETTTAVKTNIDLFNEQSLHQLSTDSDKSSLPTLQTETSHQQTLEKVETPEDIQQQNLEQQFEDLNQAQSPWFQTNNWQHHYDQQNVEQQFEKFLTHEINHEHHYLQDFGQHIYENGNKEDQNNLQDFDQQVQSFSPLLNLQNKQEEQERQSQYHNSVVHSTTENYEQYLQPLQVSKLSTVNTPQIIEPVHDSRTIEVQAENKNLLDNKKTGNPNAEAIQPPVEISTEKPGFWKSVGAKLSNAKNKVVSWFSSS